MAETKEICRLEYFYGTLATAYKGVITSLVAKDFCMTEESGNITLAGAILAMPEGDYDARLMHEGKELSRSEIINGSFRFMVEDCLISRAKNLQIDIIQKGRHVGTFLLKRERSDEFYTSAVELSDETRDLAPHALAAPLRNRPGLLNRGEEIISIILSPKRDWQKLSENINSFSKDLYWADRSAFVSWYRELAGWAARACSFSAKEYAARAAANFLALAEIVADNSPEQEGCSLMGIWLESLKMNRVDMASHLHKSAGVLMKIKERFPDVDISEAAGSLVSSLKDHVANTPVISNATIEPMNSLLNNEDLKALRECSETKKSETMAILSDAEALLGRREYATTLRSIQDTAAVLLDDSEMIERIYSVIERHADRQSGMITAEIIDAVLKILPQLSPDAMRKAFLDNALFIKKIIALNMTDLCRNILNSIAKCPPEIKEGMLLNQEVASAVASSGSRELIRQYIAVIGLLHVPSPRITGFSSETWAEIANPLHIRRLSKVLAVLGAGAGSFETTLTGLLCNLYISGVFIPDDKLFQRDISAYLNSGALKENFLINYMLLKRLPVYFNEIGATNIIRDDTTEIDSWADDPILYFLRKQIHVNSSNYNVRLVEEIIRSWVSNDPECLKDVVPPDVYAGTNKVLLAAYSHAVRPVFGALGVLDHKGLHLDVLLSLPDDAIEQSVKGVIVPNGRLQDEIKKKIILICRIYRGIVRKYTVAGSGGPDEDVYMQLSEGIDKIRVLKKTLISPEKTLPEENLFFKRHIAFGIPSVLGTYHEAKFDALSEILRIETGMALLFEGIIREAELMQDIVTVQDFRRWTKCLDIMNELAEVHDMHNFQISELMTMMKTSSLYVSQVIDLLRIWQKEMTWMVDSLTRRIHAPLAEILISFPRNEMPEYLRGLDTGTSDYTDRAADVIIRDMISSITGFTETDRFIEVLIKKCRSMTESEPDVVLMHSDNLIEQPVSDFQMLHELSGQDAMRMAPMIGGKAKNLVYLLDKNLPVPYAAVFSAMRTRNYDELTEDAGFMASLRKAVGLIEARTRLIFGDSQKPLFLSVRSGSYISMPGILSSILYCGMNDTTRKALADATGDSLLSWDSYRRFIDHYSTVVLGLDERIFSKINAGFLEEISKSKIDELNDLEMSEIVRLYKKELSQRNLGIPDDVYRQLGECASAVYASWYGEKAVHFRTAMKISEHWGTAVILMQMIQGNRKGSGASVFFTRNPSSLERKVYGDTRETATGDDLVYGRLINRPLGKSQALQGQKSLEEEDPELFAMHEELSADIEEAMGGLPQEVEATYISEPNGERKIYILQTRRMEFHRGFIKHFRDICRMESNIIGRGVGVHGGALSGTATFAISPERIETIRKETGLPVILLRKSSSTNDVSLMPHIDGIVTSAGGATSHAAILAQKFGLTAVVGCSDMDIRTDAKGEPSAQIGSLQVTEGTFISIDGSTGLVYSGSCEFTTETRS